jgi:hypothetical protein
MGVTMVVDRDLGLLKEVVSELARLKDAAEGPTRFLTRLYASALEEWASRLGMGPLQLNKLVPPATLRRGTVLSRTEAAAIRVAEPPVLSLWR